MTDPVTSLALLLPVFQDGTGPAGGAADGGGGSYVALGVFVAIALGVSFLCSVWEAVLLSTPRAHLAALAEPEAKGFLGWLDKALEKI